MYAAHALALNVICTEIERKFLLKIKKEILQRLAVNALFQSSGVTLESLDLSSHRVSALVHTWTVHVHGCLTVRRNLGPCQNVHLKKLKPRRLCFTERHERIDYEITLKLTYSSA